MQREASSSLIATCLVLACKYRSTSRSPTCCEVEIVFCLACRYVVFSQSRAVRLEPAVGLLCLEWLLKDPDYFDCGPCNSSVEVFRAKTSTLSIAEILQRVASGF